MFKRPYFILFLYCAGTGWMACNHLAGRAPADPQAKDEVAAAVKMPKEITLDLTNIDEHLLPDTVDVYIPHDHVFKTDKRYRALPLAPILEQLIRETELDTAATEVFFVCKDGYIPSMPLPEALRAGGYLAFHDLEAPASKLWTDSLAHDYSPYLLVWQETPYEAHGLPWSWGLTSLRLVEGDPGLQSLYPADAPELADAFDLFQQNCLKCHAINQTGGIMGPEFNDPKNITGYWTRENIVAFAQSPTSFRRNSKMPPIQHLKEEELHRIVDYLEYIARR